MLNALIADAVKNGLSKFTLWQTRSGWQANAMYNDSGAWVCFTHQDVTEAMKRVLGATHTVETDKKENIFS